MSAATAKKIKGGMFKSMPGLGHFPATENPARFVPHLSEAIEFIQKRRAEQGKGRPRRIKSMRGAQPWYLELGSRSRRDLI
jgi:hypothetical protein